MFFFRGELNQAALIYAATDMSGVCYEICAFFFRSIFKIFRGKKFREPLLFLSCHPLITASSA